MLIFNELYNGKNWPQYVVVLDKSNVNYHFLDNCKNVTIMSLTSF